MPEQRVVSPRKLAIIGHPIGHSLSPLMHNTACVTLGLPFTYEAIDVPEHQLRSTVNRFVEEGYRGFSVTIPHKRRVLALLDAVDATATACGAVNTVLIDGLQLKGYNTDVLGIVESLKPFSVNGNFDSALILGAGGATRAVLYALTGIFKTERLTVAARTLGKAESLARDIGIKVSVINFEESSVQHALDNHTLIINTTPIGMYPAVDASPILIGTRFRNDQIVFDLVYRPLQTKLLRIAENGGARTIGGLEMLIHQGAAAFHIWTGETMPTAVVKAALAKKLEEENVNAID